MIRSFLTLLALPLALGCYGALAAEPTTPPATASAAVQVRGGSPDVWETLAWNDLSSDEQTLWRILGWTQASWDEEAASPASEQKVWSQLSAPEREAAAALGYDEPMWNE